MTTGSASRIFLWIAVAALVGCTPAEGSTDDTLGGVGKIPGANGSTEVTLPANLARNVDFPDLIGPVVGTVAKGNRVLLIGDSILASTASRYGGAMCSALVPAGWRTAVEAEPGRFVPFGKKVLAARLGDGWDAAVVFLGTNYSGGVDNYKRDLGSILDQLQPRPTVLVTTSLFREKQKEVNTAILEIAATRTNITVLDWATISSQPGVLASDRIHPSTTGIQVLARSVGRALGVAPKSPGSCLASTFINDTDATEGAVPVTTVPSGAVAPPPPTSTTTSTLVPSVSTTTSTTPAG